MIQVDLNILFSFRKSLNDKGRISIEVPEGATVEEILAEAAERFPEFEGKVLGESGEIRRFIQIRLNKKNIERIDGLKTRLNAGDEIQILPKLGGG